MLIEAFELEMVSPPCDPGSERWSAFLRLEGDIREVLPYLNALWPGAIYDPGVPVLTMVRGGRRYSLRPLEIGVSNVRDREDAQQIAERLVREINGLWDRRESIIPSTETRRRPGVMEVYRLLPGGNCRSCGEATCFIFATKLVAGQLEWDRCSRLFEHGQGLQRETLESAFSG